MRSCTHRLYTRVYSQRPLTSLIYESQLFIVTVGFASLTNDRDIIILFVLVVILGIILRSMLEYKWYLYNSRILFQTKLQRCSQILNAKIVNEFSLSGKRA